MKLHVVLKNSEKADGIYKVTAKGCLAAGLRWGTAHGPLDAWTEFAVIPLHPNGTGEFVYTGGRSIPPEATHVYAKAVRQDMSGFDTASAPIPFRELPSACSDALRLYVLSDLHLTKTPWRVRNALRQGADGAALLLLGDMVNDGLPEQFRLLQECIEQTVPELPLFAVAGNHDYPVESLAEENIGYPQLEDWLLGRLGYHPYRYGPGRAYAVRIGKANIIGLNAAAEGRRFVFPNGDQLRWLAQCLDQTEAAWHIILCHAPLLDHNPQRVRGRQPPYLDRDNELQSIINAHNRVIFISGHTHFSYNCPIGCVDVEPEAKRIYINAASVCPTMLQSDEPLGFPAWTDATITELRLSEIQVEVIPRSLADGRKIARGYYCFSDST